MAVSLSIYLLLYVVQLDSTFLGESKDYLLAVVAMAVDGRACGVLGWVTIDYYA